MTEDVYGALRDRMVEAGLLIPTGVRGVFGRSFAFEDVIARFERLVGQVGADTAPTVVHFPPIFPRATYTQLSHIQNFPDLMGSVHAFVGKDAEQKAMIAQLESGADWTRSLAASDVMLIPAACYPLYPTLAGRLPEGGRTFELCTWVFRHEPSDDPARMQIFRQHEFIRVGTAEEALGHRDAWLRRAEALLTELGLPVRAVVANDPFFGRGGRMAKAIQLEQELKYELVVPVASDEKPTAISSTNYHLDYFGTTFGIASADGGAAHTACIGFGLERIALALFVRHGPDVAGWPTDVRARLGYT
jgi:seryl-tRNA synthetase